MKINAYKIVKFLLIIITLFISITAFYGGINLIIDPTGTYMGLQEYLPKIPFANDYFYLGIILVVANGLSQLIAFIMLIINNNRAGIVSVICASILLIWVSVQLIFIGWFYYSTTYFIISLVELILGNVFCVIYSKYNKK